MQSFLIFVYPDHRHERSILTTALWLAQYCAASLFCILGIDDNGTRLIRRMIEDTTEWMAKRKGAVGRRRWDVSPLGRRVAGESSCIKRLPHSLRRKHLPYKLLAFYFPFFVGLLMFLLVCSYSRCSWQHSRMDQRRNSRHLERWATENICKEVVQHLQHLLNRDAISS